MEVQNAQTQEGRKGLTLFISDPSSQFIISSGDSILREWHPVFFGLKGICYVWPQELEFKPRENGEFLRLLLQS